MGISFFQPIYLWAAAFIAVPVIIHLLFRKRTQTLAFSSLRFLRKSAVTASKNKRLRQFLLLAARIAAILALVAAFAQPFLTGDPFNTIGHAQSTVYCWVDPTISMQYSIDGQELWQHSNRLIRTLDTLGSPSSEILIYDDERNDFVEAHPDVDLQPRHGLSDFPAMLHHYRRIQKQRPGPHALLLFSDFQSRHTKQIDSLLATDTLKHPVLLVSVAPTEKTVRNAGVIHPRVSDELQCSVYTSGAALTDAELQVLSGDMRIGSKQVTLPADSGRIENVPFQSRQSQSNGILRLQSDDGFAPDNRLYFSKSDNRNRRVLVVGDEAETLPLRTALRLILDSDVSVRPSHAVTFEDLDSSEIIVLSGVRNSARSLEALLGQGALHDKLIIVSPSLQPDAGRWMESVYALHAEGKNPVIRRQQTLYPVLPDTVSSVWRSFPRFEDRTVKISAYMDNLPGTSLMLLSNRKPLISWRRDEQGHIWMFWATPLGITGENNFAETGFFLPMLDRMLLFGISRLSVQDQQWIAGQSRYNPYLGLSTGANVYNSDGRLVARWENQPRVSFSLPGIYSIHPDANPTRELAVNADPAEFDLTYRLPSAPAHSQNQMKVIPARQFRSFIASRSASFSSILFWLIMAVALLAETLLWAGRKKTAAKQLQR